MGLHKLNMNENSIKKIELSIIHKELKDIKYCRRKNM
jgi:hypothetical protein